MAVASAATSQNGRSYAIHKFGGTCVSTAERITNAATLVKQAAEKDQKGVYSLTCFGAEYCVDMLLLP